GHRKSRVRPDREVLRAVRRRRPRLLPIRQPQCNWSATFCTNALARYGPLGANSPTHCRMRQYAAVSHVSSNATPIRTATVQAKIGRQETRTTNQTGLLRLRGVDL